jgi:hypothetical protein
MARGVLRYDVLDFNNDVLESFDSYALAVTYLEQWETSEDKGAIRDNQYWDGDDPAGTWEIVRDNRRFDVDED